MLRRGTSSLLSCLARFDTRCSASTRSLYHCSGTLQFATYSGSGRHSGQPADIRKLWPACLPTCAGRSVHNGAPDSGSQTATDGGNDANLPNFVELASSKEGEEAINATLLEYTQEATAAAQAGRVDVAEAILEEAGREVVSAVGMDSTQYTALQHMLMTVLHAAGSWERCAEVAAAAAPVIVRVHGRVSNAHAQCLLRLAAAQVGCGTVDSVNAAGPTLGTCSEVAEALLEQGAPGDRELAAEAFFYGCLTAIYGCTSVAEIRGVQEHLLLGARSMREELGRDNGLCAAAMHTFTKLLFNSLDQGDRNELSKELFALFLQLHEAMEYGEPAIAVMQYQQGTWLYTVGDHQAARDVIQDSLDKVARNPPSEADLAQDASLTEAHEREMMLRRIRIAIIDCVMIHGGEATEAGAAESAHATLSELGAHFAELLGASNALTAEARFALALLGLAENLDAEAGAAKEMGTNMAEALKAMARLLPQGLGHILVKKLVPLYEGRFGALKLTPEEQQELRDDWRCYEASRLT